MAAVSSHVLHYISSMFASCTQSCTPMLRQTTYMEAHTLTVHLSRWPPLYCRPAVVGVCVCVCVCMCVCGRMAHSKLHTPHNIIYGGTYADGRDV